MPPEGGRGAFLTPLGVIWVNAPSGGRGQSHRGGHCFFERPPPQGKGGAINQPERARKRSDKTPDHRSFENSREVCGRMGTRFRRREGKGVDGCEVCISFEMGSGAVSRCLEFRELWCGGVSELGYNGPNQGVFGKPES
jgi:hypothetical protein